jgi:hypothetical protein
MAGQINLGQAVRDLTLIAFYYLLHAGEYTIKDTRNELKQMVQFKLEDITFFHRNELGQLWVLPCKDSFELLLTAKGATFKLDNKENGWNGVCIMVTCWAVQFLPLHNVIHMRMHNSKASNSLSTYFINCKRMDVTAEDISKHLKITAGLLNHPTQKGIPVERVSTHSLWFGGANALALTGFSDTQIQKMARWCGAIFKEHIWEELVNYSDWMSKAMKTKFNFIKIMGNALSDITDMVLRMGYNAEIVVAVAA